MIYVSKKVGFSAAHRLYNDDLDDKENYEIFDKCANLYGHGHNYVLEATIAGEPDPKTGYVIDIKKLKKIIYDEIISKVDHKHLNYDVDFLKGVIPTVENLAVKFWEILENKIPSGKLYSVKVYETEDSYAEYKGEKRKR